MDVPIIVREVHLSRRLRSHLGYSFPGTQLPPFPATSSNPSRPAKRHRNPILLAREWQRRLIEEGLSRADLAHELGVSRVRVTQVLHLLNLDAEVVDAVAELGDQLHESSVSERSLRPLLRLPVGEQRNLLQQMLTAPKSGREQFL